MNELYSLMSVNDDDLLEKTKKRRRDDFFCCYCLLMVESLSDNVTKIIGYMIRETLFISN